MGLIDRKRYAAVAKLEAMGYVFENAEWKDTGEAVRKANARVNAASPGNTVWPSLGGPGPGGGAGSPYPPMPDFFQDVCSAVSHLQQVLRGMNLDVSSIRLPMSNRSINIHRLMQAVNASPSFAYHIMAPAMGPIRPGLQILGVAIDEEL